MKTRKKSESTPKTIHFKDHPEFTPNLTPRQIMLRGSFGGTYWRPIYSSVIHKKLKNIHRKYPKEWWEGIPEDHLTRPWEDYDPSINQYKVKVGTTLEFWQEKQWIRALHPYGWFHWYCDFYQGKRGPDDERQIKRWQRLAGPKGRFSNNLRNRIKAGKDSLPMRQTLQHWAFALD